MSKEKEHLEGLEQEEFEKAVKNKINEDTMNETKRCIRKIKIADIVMSTLILGIIIIILLLRGCQGGDLIHGTVDVPGNIIDSIPPIIVPEASLEFIGTDVNENLPFKIKDMDEDTYESMLYRIKVNYNSNMILKYKMTIRDDENFKKLSEIFKVKVEFIKDGEKKLLYEGLLKDMNFLEVELITDKEEIIECLFFITVYLGSEFGEEYDNEKMMADMSWWIDDQDYISVDNSEFNTVTLVPPIEPPEDITELKFIAKNEKDNLPFEEYAIRDKDIFIHYYAFEVIHDKDVEMVIDNTSIHNSGLGEVLNIKILLVGGTRDIVLYDGAIEELSTSHVINSNSAKSTILYYKFVVTVKGLTEEFYGKRYTCGFSWSLKDTSHQLRISGNRFEAYKEPYIPPVVATSIKLTDKDGYDNIPFNVENMLPGDGVSQYYCVTVTHNSKEVVSFSTLVDTSQKLSNVLRIKIEHLIPDEVDEIIYDGLIKDCTDVNIEVPVNKKDETEIYYRITVYTIGSEVGNEYVGESLEADFIWQIK